MFRRLSSLARSPQGRRAINKAVNYAKTPEGRQRLDAVRDRLKAQRRRPPA